MGPVILVHVPRWLIWLIGGAVLLLAAAAAGGGESGQSVYYQVTYDDGRTRDVTALPETNEGISRVLRIKRIEQGSRGYEIVSTGPQPLTLVSRGQTYRTDMVWNGKAWVAPSSDPDVAIVVSAGSPTSPDAAVRAEAARLREKLIAVAGRLLESSEKLATARQTVEASSPAAAAIEQARRDIQVCLAAVLKEAETLAGPSTLAKPSLPPSGEVTCDPPNRPAGGEGIDEPIAETSALPYRVQVWPLAEGKGRRKVRVSIAHPQAGEAGQFNYVAYADTTGDGRPNRLIARSPAARAEKAGQWTQWEFETSEQNVYVGKAWDRSDTVHYHTEAIRIKDRWRGLGRQSYVAIDGWGLPFYRWGPAYGNIRVWTRN